MKRFMLYTFLLTLAVVLWGCGGSSDDDSTVVTVSLTASPETVNAPAIIDPERLFGLTQHFSRTYTARTTCRFVNLTKAEVLRLASHHDIFMLNLLNIVSTHTQRLGRQPWRTQQLTIRQKIARFVEQRALRPAGEIWLYVTMQTLATAIGESRLNLSRQLNALQQQGVLQLHRAHIYIPALEKLINE